MKDSPIIVLYRCISIILASKSSCSNISRITNLDTFAAALSAYSSCLGSTSMSVLSCVICATLTSVMSCMWGILIALERLMPSPNVMPSEKPSNVNDLPIYALRNFLCNTVLFVSCESRREYIPTNQLCLLSSPSLSTIKKDDDKLLSPSVSQSIY